MPCRVTAPAMMAVRSFSTTSRPALRAAAYGGRPRAGRPARRHGVACDLRPATVVCRDHQRRSMPSFIKNLTVDCEDALRVARFWAAALVSDVDEESTPKRAYVEAPGWGGPNIWFRGGRGLKTAPNRVHLDLRALTSMSEEADRLVTLGARV